MVPGSLLQDAPRGERSREELFPLSRAFLCLPKEEGMLVIGSYCCLVNFNKTINDWNILYFVLLALRFIFFANLLIIWLLH